MPRRKEVYIVAGPNGAGKTTFVKQFLPKYVKVRNFVNADEIAQGLSPLDAASMNIKSGRIMLELINSYKKKGESFGFETTLAGKKWLRMIEELKAAGYKVYVFFLDLVSVDLAVSRVKYRVESGGHNIPEETVRRRYVRSRQNFWYNYKEATDGWHLFDNSAQVATVVAKSVRKKLKIINLKYFNFFQEEILGASDKHDAKK